ncbi:MAG: class I SAM-dependent methyltransferase [Acidobacteriaceae bacterium]|nr:class I SAM-dependent methyltransferase [Acidobacteriaceae bacterium]
MNTKSWKEVWEDRRLDAQNGSVLTQLMTADGLDTGFGSVGEEAWRTHVARTAAALGITGDSSVFEVGCGAGAYLFDLYQAGCRVSGCDFSSALIEYAREVMPKGEWRVCEAIDIDETPQCDFVISSAAFLYFPSLQYASEVLMRMVNKARRAVMILDLPDAAKQEAALAFRRGTLGEAAYAQKYQGLDHLYFDKRWFTNALNATGVRRVLIEDQNIEGYGNSAYRFNAFGWLK